MKILVPLFIVFFVIAGYGQERKYVTVQRTQKLMGSRFEINVVAINEEIGYIRVDEAISEITRIEKMISSWDPESETSLINKNAGIKPVKVSIELFNLIKRAKQISVTTEGAFDISYASMDKIWKFDGSMKYMPSDEDLKRSIAKVGHEKIILDTKNQTVFLRDQGMKISFGAIGKGYAAERAKELLVSKQVVAGIINASGDLTTWGTKASGEKWLIGIANPLSKEKIFSWLPIVESSVATSGNYEKFVILDGKKYSHIIDPRTGYPSRGINSVTIFNKSAELCDALATAVFILGKDAGLSLINQFPVTEVILVDGNNKIHKSSGIQFDNNP